MLIGRLGADPEIKQTKKGESFANLSLATNKKYKDKSGEWVEKTTWHKVVVWDPRLSENMQKYAKTGTQLYVDGELETRQFKDSNTTCKSRYNYLCYNSVLIIRIFKLSSF